MGALQAVLSHMSSNEKWHIWWGHLMKSNLWQDIAKYFKVFQPGLEVIKLKIILTLKIERNDLLLVDTCP